MTGAGTRSDRRDRVVLAVAVIVNVLVLYWPRHVSQGGIPSLDKVVHVTIFAVVAIVGVRARVPLAWLIGLLVAQAVGSELIQHWFLVNRSGDPADVAADLVGVALGVLIGVKVAARTGVGSSRPRGSLLS